jgi:hypothetical protein
MENQIKIHQSHVDPEHGTSEKKEPVNPDYGALPTVSSIPIMTYQVDQNQNMPQN